MLHVISGKVLYYILLPLLFLYGKTARRPRVRALLMRNNTEVLLIKDWLGPDVWTLPGGGMNANESEREALSRELQEELGLNIATYQMEYIETIALGSLAAPYKVSIYAINGVAEDVIPKSIEVTAARWFSVAQLPQNTLTEVKDVCKRRVYD